MALCSKCPRVFHKRCLDLSTVNLEKQFVCSVCKVSINKVFSCLSMFLKLVAKKEFSDK